MKIDYVLPGRSRETKTGLISPQAPEYDRPPRVTCLLALAHRFEALVRSGEVKDYADLARAGRVSRARVSQILKLLMLEPSIQERLLWLPPRSPGSQCITERDLREVVQEPHWDRQRALFDQMVATRLDTSASAILRRPAGKQN